MIMEEYHAYPSVIPKLFAPVTISFSFIMTLNCHNAAILF